MRVILDKECQKTNSNWEKVYAYDTERGLKSDENFAHYEPKDGDVIIWDKVWDDRWVQHAGIAAKPYDLLYAGARDPGKHGFGRTDIYNYTGHPPFGSPSAVYRYRGINSRHH